MRSYGPLRDMRFDPHPDGPPRASEEGVLYTAGDIATALAEIYQRTRIIDTTTGTPYLTGWRPTRLLRLLDLTGDWPVRAGASHAHQLRTQRPHPSLGLRPSAPPGPISTDSPTTPSPATKASPSSCPPQIRSPTPPATSRPLGDPATLRAIYAAADRIN